MRWPFTVLLLTLICALALPAVADESEQENPFSDLPDKGESHAANAFEQAKDSIAVVVARSPDGSPVSQGSGVVVAPGVLVTNWHVVAGSASIEVRAGGRTHDAAIIRATEQPDLALLRIENESLTPIKPPIGETGTGENVYTIGAPKGLELTLSDGIVSAVRTVRGTRYLQTTANIAPGSSGGALVDASGRLLGITTSRVTGESGLNFAVAYQHVEDLLTAEGRDQPSSERAYSSVPAVSGMYAIDANANLLQLVDPDSFFVSDSRVGATFVARMCVEDEGCGIQLRRRVVVDCVSQRGALLLFEVDSYAKEMDPRTLTDVSPREAEWTTWGSGERAAVNQSQGQLLCAMASESPEARTRRLASDHDEHIANARCPLFRTSELFDFQSSGESGNLVVRQSKVFQRCQ